ncbi:double zinc ribbon domain-containing protein [Deinococcus metallilatus]|uniref:RNA-binding Zn-ribbon protein involved in translation (DUF1610 family) n=1 Tax=Deinococcus metallilatus TaxID=1211322 RepID=A0ABR6MSZ9_9DEIO|nr:zinc ribbon domain-containing protein [Deinococcus metallilatus]MBB5295063.1 putative RNA-binding Zn-ribbon protein involved in translation (DUF1610 family) [Deinococcus metallilatus]
MPRNPVSYHLCPRCGRAVPAQTQEVFCVNDGTRLLTACPGCAQPIRSPYSQFCPRCGQAYAAPLPRPQPGL